MKSTSNTGVNTSNQAKEEVVFGKPNLSQKPSPVKNTDDNANGTSQKSQVYLLIHLFRLVFVFSNLYLIFSFSRIHPQVNQTKHLPPKKPINNTKLSRPN